MFGFIQSLTNSSIARQDSETVMADYVVGKNTKALAALYDRYANDLYHYLLSMSDPALAQDIVQKTWLKLVEKPASYQRASSVKAFLFTIARNALIDEFRKTNRMTSLEDEMQSSDTALLENSAETSPDSNAFSSEDLQMAFDNAFDSLSFVQREAFSLQQEGFSLEQIAHITACNQETIKTRLRYAKAQLKQKMEVYRDAV
jgi:RNA polymerase sigma-70 factor (ECF subfamily)